MSQPNVSVIGAGKCDAGETGRALYKEAMELGSLLAGAGYTVVCGGLGGVMEAVCRGAKEAGGHTIGILPFLDRAQANPYVQTAVATGLGQMRNMLVVANGDIVVAVGGGYGTLSEVALAKKSGKEVIAIGSMAGVEGVVWADDARHACSLVKKYFDRKK
ncbi:TIGR00725 family protein [Pseudodesulfovibrio cashew]|uniref:TIGR00725 family protein n=1 Tax=Pseudodesulfovibrio cashew TaxID=2678688 RepID=A0A6I6JJQ1_9BACT|nr:TIGR00725 family protein [Pseudodesulfovibrio cashew]QGY41198.1 TIGR00725 family protein [Pseudodesulfovibrio cashew]